MSRDDDVVCVFIIDKESYRTNTKRQKNPSWRRCPPLPPPVAAARSATPPAYWAPPARPPAAAHLLRQPPSVLRHQHQRQRQPRLQHLLIRESPSWTHWYASCRSQKPGNLPFPPPRLLAFSSSRLCSWQSWILARMWKRVGWAKQLGRRTRHRINLPLQGHLLWAHHQCLYALNLTADANKEHGENEPHAEHFWCICFVWCCFEKL